MPASPPPHPTEPRPARLRVQTLGDFRAWVDGTPLSDFGRGKALVLFQFLITARRQALQKEQIIERLWPELEPAAGDRDFRVALNALENALEPTRARRTSSGYVRRQGQTYTLDMQAVWLDAEAFERVIADANAAWLRAPADAYALYQRAAELYGGDYLPERVYDDWSSAERERLQTLALGAMARLADMALERDPLESIRMARRVLAIEPAWEDAYRVEMRAHLALGNRAMAQKAYERCARLLREEFDLDPLPETRALAEAARRAGSRPGVTGL